MQVWKIVLLNPTNDWGRFVKEKAVFVGKFGPEDLNELDKFSCKEDIEEFLSEGAAAELWKFSHDVMIGDAVIAATDKEILGVGKITSGYSYDSIFDPTDKCYNKAHTRRTEWAELKPHLARETGDPLFKPLPKEFESLNNQIKIAELSLREWEAIGKRYPKVKEASQKLGIK
ncbi:MAG: hypothetical protein WED04_10295 [Promethearchaeati archaeon SRVP18_Atabeyarchaeia-1]